MDKQIDERMDFYFNVIFDIIVDWRKGKELI